MSAAFWDLRDRLKTNARARELAQWGALEHPGENLGALLESPPRDGAEPAPTGGPEDREDARPTRPVGVVGPHVNPA